MPLYRIRDRNIMKDFQELLCGAETENGIQAVLFDLDGSLVDSMWMWKAIDEGYLGSFGITMPAGLQEDIGGRSIQETAVYFKQRFGIRDSEETMMEQWNHMAYDKYAGEVPLKPGAASFISWCRNRGIRLGVATSNSRELTEAALKANGVLDCFDAIVTGDEVVNGKPSPDVYLTAAAKVGIRPRHCLVFEDIVSGIQAARSAGMRVIAVQDDHSSAQEDEKRALADGWIRDYRDLGILSAEDGV
jgi:HAD superfamily hydrolase (TIGR01509 family)